MKVTGPLHKSIFMAKPPMIAELAKNSYTTLTEFFPVVFAR